MSTFPIHFEWTGEEMRPLSRFAKECDKRFVIGERYCLEEVQQRSMKSHAHYFASIASAWGSLPEEWAERFPTPDHLRRYALIKAGYCDQRTIVCASKAEAHRIAAFITPMDTYALVLPFDATVTVWTAKSQSLKAMGRKDFQASKDAVLEIVAGLVGVKPSELPRQEAA